MRILLLLLLCLPSWGAFSHYTCFTVDHTKVPSDQTGFPVLISVTDARFKTAANGGNVQHASGYDIYAYTSSALSTRIPMERVVFVGTTGQIEMHALRTLSSSVDTPVCLAYGDSGISSDPNSDATYGTTSVWDANYLAVYHHKDGTTLSRDDSTSNARTLSDYGGTPTATSGKIDGAVAYGSGVIGYNASVAWPTASDITVELWLNASATGVGDKGTWCAWTVNGGTRVDIGLDNDNVVWSFGNATTGRISAAYGSYNNAWTHVVVTGKGDNSGQVIYLNGSSAASQGTGAAPTGTYSDAQWGRSNFGNLAGSSFDEARVSKVVRSADYVTTAYNNQNSPATFYAMGAEDGGAAAVVRRRIIN